MVHNVGGTPATGTGWPVLVDTATTLVQVAARVPISVATADTRTALSALDGLWDVVVPSAPLVGPPMQAAALLLTASAVAGEAASAEMRADAVRRFCVAAAPDELAAWLAELEPADDRLVRAALAPA